MFFNPAKPDVTQRTKTRRQASKELQNVIDRGWQAEYPKVLEAGIAAGLQDDELKRFIQRIRHKVQLRTIGEFQKELKRIVTARQKPNTSSTIANESAVQKSPEYPTAEDHLAKRPKCDRGGE